MHPAAATVFGGRTSHPFSGRRTRETEAPLVRLIVRQMNEGSSVNRAMLALVARGAHVSRGDGQRAPAFDGPSRIIRFRGMLTAGNFATHGPIKAGR